MHQFRQIISRMRLGQSDRDIARAEGVGRKTVAKVRREAQEQGWADPAAPLPDDAMLAACFGQRTARPQTVSSLEMFRDQIVKWHSEAIQGTTIHAALVRKYHYSGSYSAVRRFLQSLGGATIEASVILDFAPAQAAQVDFGAGPKIVDQETGEIVATWFFVMTLAWSRHQYTEFVRDQTVATWLQCHRHAFEFFNGVPAKVIIDNPKCAITRACIYEPTVQRSYAELAEGYGFLISPCAPRDPKKKGRVESGVKYVKNNFLPLRQFTSVNDANKQVKGWVMGIAGNRRHGSTYEAPLKRFIEIEQALLKALPAVAPESPTWAKAIVQGNGHAQYARAFYSAPYRLIRQTVWLRVTPATVQIYHDNQMVALHPRLLHAGGHATVDDHLPPDALAFKMRDPQWCLAQATTIGPACQKLIERLFAHRVLDNLRAAQGIVRFAQKFGAARLEAACARALTFDAPRYRTVKQILDNGLDLQPELALAIDLNPAYTGAGKFTRTSRDLLH